MGKRTKKKGVASEAGKGRAMERRETDGKGKHKKKVWKRETRKKGKQTKREEESDGSGNDAIGKKQGKKGISGSER